MFDPKKILVLAPHTDDGELGCGGTLAWLSALNKDIHYAAFSNCSKSLPADLPPDTLEKECKAAIQELGMHPSKLLMYDFEVRDFPARRQEILEELVSLNKYIQPDLVFIPSATDIHQDHQVIHHEALRAFKKSSLLGYELPWNQRQFSTDFFVPLKKENLERKIKALSKYDSQSHRAYMQEEFTTSLARVRGLQCDNVFAEAFEVYRIQG